MKVYVDELPINCASCFCIDNELPFCNLTNEYVRDECDMFKERCPNCPLQSITDYTKQVSREVVEKIKKHIDTQLDFYNTELDEDDEDDDNYAVGYVGGLKWAKDVLDLMKGETQ